MQEFAEILDFNMANQEERIKGLETVTATLRENVAKIQGTIESLSTKDSSKSHWLLPIMLTVIFGALIGLYTQEFIQGNKITAILAVLQPQAILKSISAVSAKPEVAKKTLAQIATSIKQLNQAKINLPEKTVDETSVELSKLSNIHKDLPETWTAIGQFITYRSQMARGWEQANLPLCDDQFHKTRITAPISPDPKDPGQSIVTHGPVEIHDCKMILDSPDTTANLSVDLSMAQVNFQHCVIFYNGGPIIVAPVKMASTQPPHFVGSVHFRDCLFVITSSSIPDHRGQELIRALLVSPSGDIELERIS
jgi:hypothetical protein